MAAVNITFPGNLAQVRTADDLRRIPTTLISGGTLYLVVGLEGVFSFDPGSSAADDGAMVLRPSDRTPMQVGRWLKSASGLASGPAGATGPADNTYTSYTAMQQSDPARQSARLVGDTDVPPHADGSYNNPTETVGGWVPQGATGIATKPGWTIAPARDVESKANDIASIFDVIPPARHKAIQARTTDYEATADLRKAIVDSAAQRLRLVLPAGAYNVRPETLFASEPGACLNALPIVPYMNLSGPGATLRVVNGVSTDAAPRLMSLFGTNGTPHDVTISDLVLDMNGANNPISPQRAEHIFNYFPQAAFYVSGTPGAKFNGKITGSVLTVNAMTEGVVRPGMALNFAGVLFLPYRIVSYGTGTGGVGTYNLDASANFSDRDMSAGIAARADDVLIKRVTMQNGPGVSAIVMAQSNTNGVTLGQGWTLDTCLFQNKGFDTNDCSFIFAWADDVTSSRCRFRNDVQVDDYGTGGLVAYEVHGSRHKFLNNRIDNFFQGIWIGENRSDDVNDTLISGNGFKRIKAVGIATFGNDSPFVTYNHNLVNNTIIFDDLLHPGYPLKQGVSITSLNPRRDVLVDGLRVISLPGNPVASCATAINAPTMPGIHDQLVFRNVDATGTTFRHYARTNAERGLGTIIYEGGKGFNLTPAGAFGEAADISVDASGAQVDHLIMDRPNAIDFRLPPQCAYASKIRGNFGRVTLKPGDRRGMVLGGHVEEATSISARGGEFEKTVIIAPPTIAAGASFTTTVAFPAVSFSDSVSVGFSKSLGGLIAQMPTAGAGVVEQTFTNVTAATIDVPTEPPLKATYITRKPA